MNESWPAMMMSTAMVPPHKATPPVSDVDVSLLLKGKTYGKNAEEKQSNMCPPIPEFDPTELKELEDYCKKRGIIGVNFGSMSPRMILKMLKGKSGERVINETKKELLHG
jgi:hypothetical protein